MVKYFWGLWIWENSFIENFEKKINKIKLINAEDINDNIIQDLNNIECLIIDNFNNNIEEKLFLFHFKSIKTIRKLYFNQFLLTIKNLKFELKDLQSRINSFFTLVLSYQQMIY